MDSESSSTYSTSIGVFDDASPSTISMALLFGSIFFATSSLAARSWLSGDSRAIDSAFGVLHTKKSGKSEALNLQNFQSIFQMLYQFCVFGLILMFAYICEYHPIYPHGDKNSYDRDHFFFLLVVLIFVSAFTITKNKGFSEKNKKNKNKQYSGQRHHSSTIHKKKTDDEMMEMKEIENKEHDNDDDDDTIFSSSQKSSTSNNKNEKMMDVDLLASNHSHDDDESTDDMSFEAGNNKILSTVTPVSAHNDVLNRDQTEEWKGWMQFMFLLYHYYHAEEIYNSIRIMITAYVFMTGFGNFSFFYLKNDYSWQRVLQMLWRLNFLVIFLSLSQGTTYILYYICPLHTFFFGMVYVTMRTASHLNYTKYGLRCKMAILAIVIFLVWDVDSGLFHLFHFPFLSEKSQIGAKEGSMWEWYFRTSLDHWSTFLGMIFAANFPITSLFIRKLEEDNQHSTRTYSTHSIRLFLGKAALGASLSFAFYIWATGPFSLQSKYEYNLTNPFFGFIPLITYIYFRNLTPKLRSYHLELLHQIGKTTLETYLMQHHIWLTSDAKSILILIPGWHKCNMLVVTILYFYISRKLYKITLYLRGMILPDKAPLQTCLQNLGGLAVAIGSFYAVAVSLHAMGLAQNMTVLGLICMACGFLIYQSVMDNSWAAYRETAQPISLNENQNQNNMNNMNNNNTGDALFDSFLRQQQQSKNHPSISSIQQQTQNSKVNIMKAIYEKESPIAKMSPPIIGTWTLFILGSILTGFAKNGAAGKLNNMEYQYHSSSTQQQRGLLKEENCAPLVNNGAWIPLDICNEEQIGKAFREYDVQSLLCPNTISAMEEDSTTSSSSSSSSSSSVQTLSGYFAWGWNTTSPNSLCRFSYRTPHSLKHNTLGRNGEERTLVFVGDSMTRNLFWATLRMLGVPNAGDYDATFPKHSDIRQKVHNIIVDFRWAPLAQDQLDVIQTLLNKEELSPKKIAEKIRDGKQPLTKPKDTGGENDKKTLKRIDVIVAGGGAWDRLHVWATDEDQASHKETVKDLAKEISSTVSKGIPFVWTIPTTINTPALNHEDKRDHMKEEDLEEMRVTYEQLGVLDAASFVIDGRKFTKDRVMEAYDGVHYPHHIYDAGAQILANAMDWLLVPSEDMEFLDMNNEPKKKQPGSTSNPILGLMMLCISFIGLFFFDGYFGFSYISSLFVKGVMPNDLYEEAFTVLHMNAKLPRIQGTVGNNASGSNSMKMRRRKEVNDDDDNDDEEMKNPKKKKNISKEDEEFELLLKSGGNDE